MSINIDKAFIRFTTCHPSLLRKWPGAENSERGLSLPMCRSKPPGFYYPEEGSQLPALIDYVREREAREFELGVTAGIFDTTFRLLRFQIGSLSDRLQNQVDMLSLEQVKQLGIALLKFESKTDLINWLKANPPHYKQTRKEAKTA